MISVLPFVSVGCKNFSPKSGLLHKITRLESKLDISDLINSQTMKLLAQNVVYLVSFK